VGGEVQGKPPNAARPVIKSQQLTALPEPAEATGQYTPPSPVFSIADPHRGTSQPANESTDVSYSMLSPPNPLRAISRDSKHPLARHPALPALKAETQTQLWRQEICNSKALLSSPWTETKSVAFKLDGDKRLGGSALPAASHESQPGGAQTQVTRWLEQSVFPLLC